MANTLPKTDHLKATQWQAGQSGNPRGKPRGAKHLSSWIQELMSNEMFSYKLKSGEEYKGAPIEAIIHVLISRAIDGDVRAFEALAKFGYGSTVEIKQVQLPTPILTVKDKTQSCP